MTVGGTPLELQIRNVDDLSRRPLRWHRMYLLSSHIYLYQQVIRMHITILGVGPSTTHSSLRTVAGPQ